MWIFWGIIVILAVIFISEIIAAEFQDESEEQE